MAKSEEGMVKSNTYLDVKTQSWNIVRYTWDDNQIQILHFAVYRLEYCSVFQKKNNQNARLFNRPLPLFPASQVSSGSLIPQVPLGMEARSMAE